MGLLDTLNNPYFQLGSNIFGNAYNPGGQFGPALSGGIQDTYKQQYLAQQEAIRKRQMEMQEAQLKQQQSDRDQMMKITGGVPWEVYKYKNPQPAEWEKKYQWMLQNPDKAAKLSGIGAIGGKGTTVSVNPFQENQRKKESEEIGKMFAQDYMDIIKAGKESYNSNARLDRLNALLEQTYTGTGGEAYQAAGKAAQMLGIDISGVGEGEAATALANEMALQLRSPAGGAGMPGALSDKDREFLVSMVPGLATTPEGRKKLIETRKKLNQRSIDVARLARQYRKKNGLIDEGFYDELEAFSTANPLFSSPGGSTGEIRVLSISR